MRHVVRGAGIFWLVMLLAGCEQTVSGAHGDAYSEDQGGTYEDQGPRPDLVVVDGPVADAPSPDQQVPDQLVPDQLAPDQLVPDQLVPDQLAPDQLVPDQLVPDLPLCGPHNCTGCCASLGGPCVAGTTDSQCGIGGMGCLNCTVIKQICSKSRSCAPCTPVCKGKKCGDADGCGSTCKAGSGCCTPSCKGKTCGQSDGCGKKCSGSCPWKYKCSSYKCVCGPSPHFKVVSGKCLPSCGQLLGKKGLPDAQNGCCKSGCKTTMAGGPGTTWDCSYCCSSTSSQSGCK